MFQPIESNVSVYKKIAAQIQDMIERGELKKGDRLPPERQLAEMLQVGRPALKQAISALEMMGVIRSRQGDGNYVASDSVELLNPLAVRSYLDHKNGDDILEFRYITREQLAEFQELMDAMRRETEAGADMAKRKFYNNLFHYQIVELCDNKLIESIYSSMMGLISDHISYTDGKDFYKSHLRIFEAIKAGNSAGSERCMAEHIQNKFPNYQHYQAIYGDVRKDFSES